MPEHWFPAKSKIVIVFELEGNRVAFHVDSTAPNRWRDEPYYGDIKALACQALLDGQQVVVCIGKNAIVILPDRDVNLGFCAPDDRIVTLQRADLTWDAFKLNKDDPRIAGMTDGVPFSRVR